jgi:ABC-type uncharacterized transport system ATPase subunit
VSAILSIANQQMVEIARALTVDAKAVIFDEPTASLTDAEKVVLFDVIEDLKAMASASSTSRTAWKRSSRSPTGSACCATAQYRGTLNTAETNEDEITQLMIGRKLDLSRNVNHTNLATSP